MAHQSIVFGKLFGASGAGTDYRSIYGDDNFSEAQTETLWLVSGVFRNLRIRLTAAVTAATTLTFTLRINESSTAMTITFNPGDTSKTYTASDISVTAGDRVAMESVNTGTGGGAGISWSMEFEPTSGSASCYGGIFHNGSGATPIILGVLAGVVAGGCTLGLIPCAGTITALGVCTDSAPGSGNALYTLWKDSGGGFVKQDGSGGTVDTRVSIGAVRTASATFSLSVAAGDVVYCTYERTGGSPINLYGGVSIAFDPTTAGQFIVPGHTRTTITGGGIWYHGGEGGMSGGNGATPVGASCIGPISPMTLSHLRVLLSTAPGSSKTWQFDFTIDESTSPAAGSPTVSLTGAGTTTGTDSTNTLALTDDHLFTMRASPTGSPATATAEWAAIGTMGSAGGAQPFALASLMFFG